MSTTEYVLDIFLPGPKLWREYERDLIRIRRVHPACETVWEGEAREVARVFAEMMANQKAECQRQLQKIGEEFIEEVDDGED